MEKYTKFLCLNLVLGLVSCLLPLHAANPAWSFNGDYFIYSSDLEYVYGGGHITMTLNGSSPVKTVTGESLYLALGAPVAPGEICGVIYGQVRLSENETNDTDAPTYDAVFFKGFPPKWLMVSFGDTVTFSGDRELEPAFSNFVKKTPEELKNASLYFECNTFQLDKNKKIKAKHVIPYMMGVPTVPLRSFTIKRGDWEEKTMLAFNNLNYSGLDGLSAAVLLRLREKFLSGDYDIKLYERQFFKMDDPKRGVLLSGQGRLFSGKTELLNYSALYNSGKESLNLRFTHRQDFKLFGYSISQLINTQEKRSAYFEFGSEVSINPLKVIIPRFQFTHDLRKSYSYRISTPIRVWKPLNVNLGWQRKILNESYRSDTSELTASVNFTVPFFSLTSNYNYSMNLLDESVRRNFTVNVKLKTLQFLQDSVWVDVSSFYMFSSMPLGNENLTRITPGVNLAVRTGGILLPLGLRLVPAFTLNHLWDNREENYTDFGTILSLQRQFGKFGTSIDYALASRYRSRNFWIEGNNRKTLNVNLELKDLRLYSMLLRFYFNNSYALENTSFNGQLMLPYDLRLSSFILYYNRESRFQTMEVFIEKAFNKKLKIQGGYSLALKRFFIKFLGG
ncbi:MAG: hypothetical protein ACM3SY_01030 [Candidatus Omnitrophota bacterium]